MATITRDVPRESWTDFFAGFSRRHEGWLVDVRILDENGAQLESENRPLQGISADHGNRNISITTVRDGKLVEHFVSDAQHVRVEEVEGAERAVEIESSKSGRTLVTFRSSMPPEMVDGLLPEQTR
jgi:Family of unknown function (DUF5335)